METVCHDPFPQVACAVRVLSSCEIAPSVFSLVVDRIPAAAVPAGTATAVPGPFPGQFFMLRARPSGVLLGRPISVYLADDRTITFLILKKGRGTAELCDLRKGDSLDLVGPIGNRFLSPAELAAADTPAAGGTIVATHTSAAGGTPSAVPVEPLLRVAIIGGGIGVAPVAGFALGLPPKSFDFYAAYRSEAYGLDGIESRARKLYITTEDGSVGVKGMLPAVFDAARYDLVYACGPTPMLRYVKEACAAAGKSRTADKAASTVARTADKAASTAGEVALAAGIAACPIGGALSESSGPRAFLSLEQRMACGAGACLGCTVMTVNGNRRCCVDGPVFDASEVIF